LGWKILISGKGYSFTPTHLGLFLAPDSTIRQCTAA
jgi:hypothetical protein